MTKIKAIEKEKYNRLRKKKEIEFLKAFLYKSYGGDCLSIFVYDTISKKVYAGNIHASSWKKEDLK